MNDFEKMLKLIEGMVIKNNKFTFVYAKDNTPFSKFACVTLNSNKMHVVINSTTNEIESLKNNPNVTLCSNLGITFNGKISNIKHLTEKNMNELTKKGIDINNWNEFIVGNDDFKLMYYIKIELFDCYFYYKKERYYMDFVKMLTEYKPYKFKPNIIEV